MKKHSGFTLIELLVALTLGLIVVAAAATLFLTSLRSGSVQQGVADLQDNANFGLNYITQDIRLANLNNVSAAINDELLLSGIVVSEDNYPSTMKPQPDPDNPDDTPPFDQILLSSSGTGPSNVEQGSDQLVIQYQPERVGGFDCEGREITNLDSMVVQRYFLRVDTNAGDGEQNPLALACDAGRYEVDSTTVTNYGDAGEIIMKRVDHFRVLLNVQNAAGLQRYMDVETYMDEPTKPRILGVSIAALTRSSQNVGTDTAIAQNNEFLVLDQTVEIADEGNPTGFIRRVVTQDVAIRNALGEREEESSSE